MHLAKKIVTRLASNYHESKISWHPRLAYRRKADIPIKQPIFLLGVQGGGLTIMSRVIRLIPNMVYISGDNTYWAGGDELHNSSRFKWMPDQLALRSPGYYNILGHEKKHPEFGYERSFIYAANEFIDEYRLTEKDWTPELDHALKEAIRTCICVYAKDPFNAQFHDMSQSYILKIPFLRRCFPDAKFIIASRNPYAVCWKQAQVSLIFDKAPERAVKLAAEHWYNSYYYGLKDAKDSDTLVLRFEEFLEDPMRISKQVFRFIGKSHINVEDLVAARKKTPLGSCAPEKWFPIRRTVNKQHMQTLPTWAEKIITEQCGEFIQAMNYSRVTSLVGAA